MPLPDIQKQNEALTGSLYETKKAAHGAGQDMEQLSKSVFSYGKALLTLGGFEAFKLVGKWGFEQLHTQRQSILAVKEQLAAHTMRVKSLQAELEGMRKIGTFAPTQIRDTELLLEWANRKDELLKSEVHFREEILRLVKEEGAKAALAVFYLGLARDAWKHTLHTVHEYNRAMITARADAGTRYGLLDHALQTQKMLGASTDDMAEATRHLVEYGNHMTPNYQAHLKLIVQMRGGLGVAANSAAEMAVVFSNQLQTSAERVGNAIAQIAANTGMAAQKATSFATEIGRALVLIGPSMRKEADQVVKLIGTMAGRVEALGGSSESVIALFKTMTGGSDQSVNLRQMTGTRLADLGTQAGVVAAMKGIDRMMHMRLTAPQGSSELAVQREALSRQVGVSAYDLLNLQKVMQDWNKTTNQALTVEQAYAKQTELMGESWKQLKNALGAFIAEALTPLVKAANWVMGKFKTYVLESLTAFSQFTIFGVKPLVLAFTVGIPVAVGVAIYSLGKLIKTIWKLAVSSDFVSAIMDAKGLPALKSFGPMALWTRLSTFATSPIGRAGGGAYGAGFNWMPATGFGLGSALTMGAGVAAAGMGGWALGRVLDKWMDKTPTWVYVILPWLAPLKLLKDIFTWMGDHGKNRSLDGKWVRSNLYQQGYKAAHLLAMDRLAGTDSAQARQAIQAVFSQSSGLNFKPGSTSGRAMLASITRMAYEEVMARSAGAAIDRAAWNAPENAAESRRISAVAQQLKNEEAALRMQERSVGMQAVQAKAAEAQLKSGAESSRTLNYQATPVDAATNRVSYGPN